MIKKTGKRTNRTIRPQWLALAAIAPWVVGMAATGVSQGPQQRRSTDPPTMSKGKLGFELFVSIGQRNLDGIKGLVSKGADVNSRNGLEFTPLYMAAATHQPDVMNTLLEAGAIVDAESPYGTPLTFAGMTGNAEGAKILLSKGANPNMARVDGDTVLMMGAQAGNPAFITELLKAKADVNATSNIGASALAYAARMGHVAVAEQLLGAGAKVDSVDEYGQTPLMLAAMAGHTDFVKFLLKHKAKVNIRDKAGRTPLMLAANFSGNGEMVQALVDAGSNVQAKDAKGRTAGQLAALRGHSDAAVTLGTTLAAPSRTAAAAVGLSVNALERSMVAFNKGAQCLSCHQDGLGRMMSASAKRRGFKTNASLAKEQVMKLRGALGAMKPLHDGAVKDPEVMKQIPLIEIAEVATVDGWLLGGMAAQGDVPTAATASMAAVLARQQMPDGSWFFALPRIPMQSSLFTTTALAVQALQVYGPRSESDANKERIAKAKAWLLATPATTSDDMTFRLLGLKWAGSTADERAASIDALLKAQRTDGGWSQVPGMRSDAYATGQALYALSLCGFDKGSAAFKKGSQFLLRTQEDDGTWFTPKRAIPANNYFDAAFPYGESQYASFNATAWATLGLLETLPKK